MTIIETLLKFQWRPKFFIHAWRPKIFERFATILFILKFSEKHASAAQHVKKKVERRPVAPVKIGEINAASSVFVGRKNEV